MKKKQGILKNSAPPSSPSPKIDIIAAKIESPTVVKIIFIEDNNFNDPIILNLDLNQWQKPPSQKGKKKRTAETNQNFTIVQIATCIDLGRLFMTYSDGKQEHDVELRLRLPCSDDIEEDEEVDIYVHELALEQFTLKENSDGKKLVQIKRVASPKDTIGMNAFKNPQNQNKKPEEAIEFCTTQQNKSEQLFSKQYKRKGYHNFLTAIAADKDSDTLQDIMDSENYQVVEDEDSEEEESEGGRRECRR